MRLTGMRLLTLLGLALATGLVASTGQPTAFVAALSVVSIAALSVAALIVLAVAPRTVTVGSRARQHRQVLLGMPEPAHPATPGRTRSRAPGGELPTA